MSGWRVFEVFLYSFLMVVPYQLLLQPFWNKRRYSWPVTIFIIIVTFLLEFLKYLAVVFWGMPGEVSYLIHMALGLIFCLVVFKAKLGKTYLTFLILMSFSNFVLTMSKFFEGLFFPQYAAGYYHLSNSLCMLPVEIIALGIDAWYAHKIYTPALEKATHTNIWKLLWIVPMTSVLIWYAVFFEGKSTYVDRLLEFRVTAWMFLVTAGFWFTDYLVARFAVEQIGIQKLERQVNFYNQQRLQFKNMNRRIDDARRARHDLRHHLHVALGYLNNGKAEDARQYLEQYARMVPNESLQTFSQNYTINTVLTYYQQYCQEKFIDYRVAVDLPQELPFSEYDLVVSFGNLIENAADAAAEAGLNGKDARVRVQSVYDGTGLLLRVENTVDKQPKMDCNGAFPSTKHAGNGIGISSVRRMVEETGGTMKILQEDGKFIVELMAYPKK